MYYFYTVRNQFDGVRPLKNWIFNLRHIFFDRHRSFSNEKLNTMNVGSQWYQRLGKNIEIFPSFLTFSSVKYFILFCFLHWKANYVLYWYLVGVGSCCLMLGWCLFLFYWINFRIFIVPPSPDYCINESVFSF